jgi:hypothetical protein
VLLRSSVCSDEKPFHMAKDFAKSHNWQTPIDEVDAAARILDPVRLACSLLLFFLRVCVFFFFFFFVLRYSSHREHPLSNV